MGCGSSAVKESELVVLCRERNELIADAANHQYKLAAAQAAYFHSLDALGDALLRFLREEVSVSASTASPPASPSLTLPPSLDAHPKRKPKTRSKPKSKSGSCGRSPVALTSSLATPTSYYQSAIGSHLPLSSGSESPADSYLLFSSGESEPSPKPRGGRSEAKGLGVSGGGGGSEGMGLGVSGGGAGGEASTSGWPPYMVENPNSSFMRSSMRIPTIVDQGQNTGSWGSASNSGYGYAFGFPSNGGISERENTMPPGTPPPPSPAISPWEFFYPFNSYEHNLPDPKRPNFDDDLRKVREEEGIPELEEDPEIETLRVLKKGKKLASDRSGEEDPSFTRSKQVRDEKWSGGTPSRVAKNGTSVSRMENAAERKWSSEKKNGFASEDISMYITEESRSIDGRSIAMSLHSSNFHPKKNVLEVVEEIASHFRLAVGYGTELSKMLDIGRLPYQSRSKMHEVISSNFLDPMTLCLTITSSCTSFKRPTHSTASTKSSTTSNSGSENHRKTGRLSSTLDKLYLWEKKLYKEVKDEEKLRISYDQKYKQLKVSTDRGMDSKKIKLAHLLINKLQTKLSIVLTSVDAVSSKMHKIREEELQPQLVELIQGFIRMWKFLLDVHQKQLQAIADSRTLFLVLRTKSLRKSVAKATKELELKLLKWRDCFTKWISIQKSYAEALNGWLTKWLHEQEEITADGIAPFSPSRIGAPSIFIFFNDWSQAMRNVSPGKVVRSMNKFISIVHVLTENQQKEQLEKLEVEHLSRVYDRKLKSLQDRTAKDLEIVLGKEDSESPHDDALVALGKKLDSKRAQHKEALKRVQDIASKVLPTGLIPTLEELETFTSETLKAYNNVRIPSECQV